MKSFVAIIAALCLAQVLDAKVIRDTTSVDSHIQDIVSKAQSALTNASTALQEAIGTSNLPTLEQVNEVLVNNSQQLAAHVKTIASQYQAKANEATGEINTVLTNIISALNHTAAQLAEAHPEATRQASEIQASFTSGLQSIVDQVKTLSASLEGPANDLKTSLQEIGRTTLSHVEEASNTAKTQVQQALESHH